MDCGLMYLAYQCFYIEQTFGAFVGEGSMQRAVTSQACARGNQLPILTFLGKTRYPDEEG
jgi:hypothetical protein